MKTKVQPSFLRAVIRSKSSAGTGTLLGVHLLETSCPQPLLPLLAPEVDGIPQPLRPPNRPPHRRFVDRLLDQDIEERPVTGLQCRPDESREEWVGWRNPGFPEQPQQRPNPGDVVGVGLTVIEPIVDRRAGDSQDAGEFGLVDRERRLQFPYLVRDGERRDVVGAGREPANRTAFDSWTGGDSRKDQERNLRIPCVGCSGDEPPRSVPVPTGGRVQSVTAAPPRSRAPGSPAILDSGGIRRHFHSSIASLVTT